MNKTLLMTAALLLLSNVYISHADAEPKTSPQQEHPNKANNAHKPVKPGASAMSADKKHQDKKMQNYQGQASQNGHGNDKKQGHQPMALERANPNANAAYAITNHNKHVMQQHYQRILGKVERHQRPTWHKGEVIPERYRPYITPAPSALIRRLNDIPPGCNVGYYQGYSVVYDPTTFAILTLVDLLVD
ncbi:hypothetical protein [Shewanella dokdonensis]|uniref:hypothetical protein n=1 Tax=Shewanella dokdonensis TaxID=712036 RepID=UPI0020109E10|nr:hypothetical protein [Shewanella dokdonensis]MCL1073138.1 hypothetical protein [Shewanella dokdonensis]